VVVEWSGSVGEPLRRQWQPEPPAPVRAWETHSMAARALPAAQPALRASLALQSRRSVVWLAVARWPGQRLTRCRTGPVVCPPRAARCCAMQMGGRGFAMVAGDTIKPVFCLDCQNAPASPFRPGPWPSSTSTDSPAGGGCAARRFHLPTNHQRATANRPPRTWPEAARITCRRAGRMKQGARADPPRIGADALTSPSAGQWEMANRH